MRFYSMYLEGFYLGWSEELVGQLAAKHDVMAPSSSSSSENVLSKFA